MSKKHLGILLKIAISASLIWLILHKIAPDWKTSAHRMMDAFRTNSGWLLAAVAATGMVFGISALRWKTILRGHAVPIPLFRAFRLFMVGFFFAQFMPGGLAAGDVVRSYYVSSCTADKKMECVATVIVDRMMGTFGLVTLIVVSLLLWGKYLASGLLIIGAGLAVFGIVLFLTKRVLKGLPFATRIYEHLPWRERLTRAYEAFRHYRNYKLQLTACWGLSVLIQFLLILIAYCVGQAVRMGAPPRQYLIAIPLVGAISSLPISFGNIGTAEAAYFLFFLGADHPAAYRSVVLAFALMQRSLWLFVGAIGGLIWLVEKGKISGKPLRGQKPAFNDASPRDTRASAQSAGDGK